MHSGTECSSCLMDYIPLTIIRMHASSVHPQGRHEQHDTHTCHGVCVHMSCSVSARVRHIYTCAVPLAVSHALLSLTGRLFDALRWLSNVTVPDHFKVTCCPLFSARSSLRQLCSGKHGRHSCKEGVEERKANHPDKQQHSNLLEKLSQFQVHQQCWCLKLQKNN